MIDTIWLCISHLHIHLDWHYYCNYHFELNTAFDMVYG